MEINYKVAGNDVTFTFSLDLSVEQVCSTGRSRIIDKLIIYSIQYELVPDDIYLTELLGIQVLCHNLSEIVTQARFPSVVSSIANIKFIFY